MTDKEDLDYATQSCWDFWMDPFKFLNGFDARKSVPL